MCRIIPPPQDKLAEIFDLRNLLHEVLFLLERQRLLLQPLLQYPDQTVHVKLLLLECTFGLLLLLLLALRHRLWLRLLRRLLLLQLLLLPLQLRLPLGLAIRRRLRLGRLGLGCLGRGRRLPLPRRLVGELLLEAPDRRLGLGERRLLLREAPAVREGDRAGRESRWALPPPSFIICFSLVSARHVAVFGRT